MRQDPAPALGRSPRSPRDRAGVEHVRDQRIGRLLDVESARVDHREPEGVGLAAAADSTRNPKWNHAGSRSVLAASR